MSHFEEGNLGNNYSTELRAVLVTQLAKAHTTKPYDCESSVEGFQKNASTV